jgi:hypothetical protein
VWAIQLQRAQLQQWSLRHLGGPHSRAMTKGLLPSHRADIAVEIDEVRGHALQPPGHDLKQIIGHVPVFAQEGLAILDHVDAARRARTHGRHMRAVEQDGHFPKHRAGFGDGIDLEFILQDLDLAIDQNAESPVMLSFGKQDRSRGDRLERNTLA